MAVTIIHEPFYKKAEPASQSEIAHALSWYYENMTENDAAKFLKCNATLAKSHMTLAWATRLIQRGFVLPEISVTHLGELRERFERATPSVTDETAEKVDIHARIEARTDYFIGELEGMLDEHIESGKVFNAYEWFNDNEVKPIHANHIAEYFQNRAKNLLEDLKDKEIAEAYHPDRAKAALKVMTAIVQDARKLAQNVNKARRPRKKKAIAAEKLVAKLNYKENDDTFKIKSISPESVLGTQQLWVFNTKTRRLSFYVAADSGGLMVKGSSLKNFDEKASFSKTLRKPELTLEIVLNGGKIALRKVMDGIRGKSYKINGRINKDTILLRAVNP